MAGGNGSEAAVQGVVAACCKECTGQWLYYGWATQENPSSQLALKKLHRKARLGVHFHLQETSPHLTPALSPLQPQDPSVRTACTEHRQPQCHCHHLCHHCHYLMTDSLVAGLGLKGHLRSSEPECLMDLDTGLSLGPPAGEGAQGPAAAAPF